MKQNTLTKYDDNKILQLAELYIKFNAKELKDESSYCFRSHFTNLFPEAVSTVSSMPLTQDTITKIMRWQRTLAENIGGLN